MTTDQPHIVIDGVTIPLLGFGTWQLEPANATRMVAEALRIGYRHIDTAWIYENEAAVGQGIRDSGVPREDIFLTTKIWVAHFDRDSLLNQAKESAESLGTTPDLLLLHWPKKTPTVTETIAALNEAKELGLTRNIGVSNFPSKEFRQAQALSEATAADQPGRAPSLSRDRCAKTRGCRSRLLDHRLVALGSGQCRRR